ncbi:MAG: hypothetical protein EXR71_13695 [Myxococcales bacterium]|nr:hypothetical protein [Myxococcales bacterium]
MSGDPFDDEPTQPKAPAVSPLVRTARDELDDIVRSAHQLADPAELFAMLATTAPIALVEVACGARAPGGAVHVRAALAHVEILERQLTPRGCYPRLAELGGEAAVDVLRVAAERHPAAGWLVKLSRKVEGPGAGRVHLIAASGRPSFAQSCVAHAEAGHIEGLVAAAEVTGRAEPAAALLPVDANVAARAAALALNTDPHAQVVAHLAAAWSPEPDMLVARLVPHLRSRAAAEALLAQSRHLPHTMRLLRAVLPGLVG